MPSGPEADSDQRQKAFANFLRSVNKEIDQEQKAAQGNE